jgi:hypothetical protein
VGNVAYVNKFRSAYVAKLNAAAAAEARGAVTFAHVNGALLAALQCIAADKNGCVFLAELERCLPGGLAGLGAAQAVQDRVQAWLVANPDPPIRVDPYFLNRCGPQLAIIHKVSERTIYTNQLLQINNPSCTGNQKDG